VRGQSGVFDVWVDGKRIFSKDEIGRFPEDDEILLVLAKLAS
jgi:predicted Rdx family selenoprotein